MANPTIIQHPCLLLSVAEKAEFLSLLQERYDMALVEEDDMRWKHLVGPTIVALEELRDTLRIAGYLPQMRDR